MKGKHKRLKGALFLDRDGVINRKIPGDYVRDWKQFEFLTGVTEALLLLQNHFSPIVVVTNQQGIGKGLMSSESLHRIHYQMTKVLRREGVCLDAIYFCPFVEEQQPLCRKPNTGMALMAQADYPHLVFEESVMVGDSDSDIAMGRALGMYTVRIGHLANRPISSEGNPPDVTVDRLLDWALML